jgi:hypothetical protein
MRVYRIVDILVFLAFGLAKAKSGQSLGLRGVNPRFILGGNGSPIDWHDEAIDHDKPIKTVAMVAHHGSAWFPAKAVCGTNRAFGMVKQVYGPP